MPRTPKQLSPLGPNRSAPQQNVVPAKQPPPRTGAPTRVDVHQVTPARPVSRMGPTGPAMPPRRGR